VARPCRRRRQGRSKAADMPKTTHRGDDGKAAAAGADGARLIVQKLMIPHRMAHFCPQATDSRSVVRGKIEFLNLLLHKTTPVALPDGCDHSMPGRIAKIGPPFEFSLRKWLDDNAPDARRRRHHGQAAEDGGLCETCFLTEFLRLAGAVAGFVTGGPAGAALGSAFAELAGNIVAERSSRIWRTLTMTVFRRARYPGNGDRTSSVDARRLSQDR
jgi:hypothetical protein